METVKSMIPFLVRYGLASIFGALVVRKWISNDLADYLVESLGVLFVTLVVTVVIPILSKIFAVKLAQEAIRIAKDANTNTPNEHIHDLAWRLTVDKILNFLSGRDRE